MNIECQKETEKLGKLNSLRLFAGFLLTKGDHSQAAMFYEAALEEIPLHDKEARIHTYFNLGKCYQNMNDPKKALEAFDNLLLIKKVVDAMYFRSLALLELDAPILAASQLCEILSHNPNPNNIPVIVEKIGVCMAKLKMYYIAMDYFKLAKKMNPKLTGPDTYMGICFNKLQMPAQALAFFESAIKARPGGGTHLFIDKYRGKAQALRNMGLLEEESACLKEALDLAKTEQQIMYLIRDLNNSLIDQGKYAENIKILQHSLPRVKYIGRIICLNALIGKSLVLMNLFDEAHAHLSQFLNIDHCDKIIIYAELCFLFKKKVDFVNLLQAANQGLTFDNPDYNLNFLIYKACSLYKLGCFQETIPVCKSILELNASDHNARRLRDACYKIVNSNCHKNGNIYFFPVYVL